MADTNIIQLFGNFFINDLFGGYLLATVFVILLVLALLLYSNIPRVAWLIFPTIIIMNLSNAGYVPTWVSMMMWIGLGLAWGIVIKNMID